MQIFFPGASKSKALIDAAIKAGVKRFVPSEFGIEKDANDEIIKKAPFMAFKLEVSDYLISKEETGLTWSGIITGGFFDW